MKKKVLSLLSALLLTPFLFNAELLWVSPLFAQEVTAEEESTEEDEECTEEDEECSEDDEGFDDEGFDDEGFDDEGFDDDEEGGDDFGTIDIQIAPITPIKSNWYSWGGFVKGEIAYSPSKPDSDYPFTREEAEVSKMRTTLNLFADFKIAEDWKGKVSANAFYDFYYSQKDRDTFPDKTLEAFESEVELRDTYIEGPLLQSLWLKTGRQIIAWGESDGSQITDMANPRDNRELGQADLEDIRMPVFSTKLAYLIDSWEFDLVAIHEFRANKIGTEGTDYDPYISSRNSFITIKEDYGPNDDAKGMEWMVRAAKSFNGGDFSFVVANVIDDNAYFEGAWQFVSLGGSAFAPTGIELEPQHKRIQVIGATGNFVSGSWLFKGEAAQKTGLAFTNEYFFDATKNTDFTEKSWLEKDTLEGMLGGEYTGITDLTLSMEIVGTQILDYEEKLANSEVTVNYSFRASYEMLDNTLKPLFSWTKLGTKDGELYRISADYDYMDGLTLSGSMVFYEASNEDAFVHPYRNNDRLILSAKYNF